MKAKKQLQSRLLRSKGLSINQISNKLGVSKSSVSTWVRDIKLTNEQLCGLSMRGVSKEVIERRRMTRLQNEQIKRDKALTKAKNEIQKITMRDLRFVGIALYWGEGKKSQRGAIQFTNSDPRTIILMMKFFKRICHVPDQKFRGHIIIHPHLDKLLAEEYWEKISQIPRAQFFKTTMQQSKSSQKKKNTLPYGTFSIEISNIKLFLSIMGWIEGIYSAKITK